MWRGSTKTPDESSDLYCYESLSNFDEEECSSKNTSHIPNSLLEIGLRQSNSEFSECVVNKEKHISDNSTVNSKDILADTPSCRRRIDYGKSENCIAILDDDDYLKLLQTDLIIDKSVKPDQGQPYVKEDKFTSSLLSEFTKTSKPAISKRPDSSTITIVNEKMSLQPHSSWSQPPGKYDEHEQQVPEINLAMDGVSGTEDDEDMDFLVIKDEAMCDSDSGSELDWNSLTPPVPASPSDQRVPELNVELSLYGGDCVNYPAPSSSMESFLSSSYSSVENSSPHWYFQPRMPFQNIANYSQSENDQVVPFL